jgi:hypothetical protein
MNLMPRSLLLVSPEIAASYSTELMANKKISRCDFENYLPLD